MVSGHPQGIYFVLYIVQYHACFVDKEIGGDNVYTLLHVHEHAYTLTCVHMNKLRGVGRGWVGGVGEVWLGQAPTGIFIVYPL